jgi:hypothetical protein
MNAECDSKKTVRLNETGSNMAGMEIDLNKIEAQLMPQVSKQAEEIVDVFSVDKPY